MLLRCPLEFSLSMPLHVRSTHDHSATPMAPHLAQAQKSQLHDMIQSDLLSNKEIARVVHCSTRTVRNARTNYRVFGSVAAPNNVRGGRYSAIPSHVLAALLDHLLSKPDLYLDEIVDFVWDQYELAVSTVVKHMQSNCTGYGTKSASTS